MVVMGFKRNKADHLHCFKFGVSLVRIFPHSDEIPRFTEEISIFVLNVRKYVPEKTSNLDTFHAVLG